MNTENNTTLQHPPTSTDANVNNHTTLPSEESEIRSEDNSNYINITLPASNPSTLVYSKEDLITIRDNVGSYAFSRPEELPALYCRDEPGNLVSSFRTANENRGEQDNRMGTRRPLNLTRPPGMRLDRENNRVDGRFDPRFDREKDGGIRTDRERRFKDRDGNIIDNPNGGNWQSRGDKDRFESQPLRPMSKRYGFGDKGDEESIEGSEDIILSPQRKTFPSSQLGQTNSTNGNNSNNNGNWRRSNPNNNDGISGSSTNQRYIPPHDRAGRRPPGFNRDERDANGNYNNRQRNYQQRRNDYGSVVQSSQLIDSLFAPGSDLANSSKLPWDEVVKFPIVEPLDDNTSTEERILSRGLGRWFAFSDNQDEGLEEDSDELGYSEESEFYEEIQFQPQQNTQQQSSFSFAQIANTNAANLPPLLPLPNAKTEMDILKAVQQQQPGSGTQPSKTPSTPKQPQLQQQQVPPQPTSPRGNIPPQHLPPQNSPAKPVAPSVSETLGMSIPIQPLIPPRVDPQKESESASFIASLLSKASVQDRVPVGPGMPFGFPDMSRLQPTPMDPYAHTISGPLPNYMPPSNMPPTPIAEQFPGKNFQQPPPIGGPFPPNARPYQPVNLQALFQQPPPQGPGPFMPGQQQPPHPQFSNANGGDKGGLEKWFGSSIYQVNMPPPPLPTGKFVSVEEIEAKSRKQ